MRVEFDLDDGQMCIVAPLLDAAEEASAKGSKGLVLAQVFADHAVADFIEPEYASEIHAVIARRRAAAKRSAEPPKTQDCREEGEGA